MQQQPIGATIGIAVVGIVIALAMSKGKSPEEIAACNADLQCLGEQAETFAEVYCKDEIAKLALHDLKWPEDTMFGRIFERYRWKDKQQGVITYIGHQAKFQNGFGAWSPVSYECDVDARNKRIVVARAF